MGAAVKTVGRAVLLSLVAAALAVTSLVAQQAPTTLSLEEAIRVAKRNNPGFLSTRNDQAAADWGVREAYGQFLPSATAQGAVQYQEAGVQRFGTVELGTQSTDYYRSFYALNLNWGLDGNSLFGVKSARATQNATEARIDAAEFALEQSVTLQYMTALRARDGVQVAQRQLDRARENLQIVQTRVQAGGAAGTEATQAEVDMGRAEAGLIQAERLLRAEKLRLVEQLGTPMQGDVELSSEFGVFEPDWTLQELQDYAFAEHPSLNAFRAQEAANVAQLRQARSRYFPSLNLSTSFQGSTLQALNEGFVLQTERNRRANQFQSCMDLNTIEDQIGMDLESFDEDCGAPTLSAQQEADILRDNNVFPFDFTKSPVAVTLAVSIPVFTGFTRQRQVEQSEAAARDAAHAVRAESLRLQTAVAQFHGDLEANYRLVQIERRNLELAEQQLVMQRQRYAVGAAALLELLDAQTSVSTAEQGYLNALYTFNQSLVALEAATGRSLRPGDDDDDEEG